MGFREQGVPEACYFGCPEINFAQLELASNVAEADIIRAEQAGVSQQGMAALREAAAARAVNARRVVGRPAEKLSAPWRPDRPPELHGKIAPIECCRYAGLVVMDFSTKDSGVHRIKRPNNSPNSLTENQETQ